MKTISSRDNLFFKQLRDLATDPRQIRKQGKTLLDGPHLVATYQQRVGSPEALIVSESGLSHPEVATLIEASTPSEIYCFRDALFREVSPSESPVGILSLIAVPAPAAPAEGDVLLLDAIQDAGNVGTLLRSAAAFGVRTVYLGAGCAGAWTPKVLRAAQGAHFGLHLFERVDLKQVLMDFPGLRLATVVQDAESVYDLALQGPLAWLVGNEGQGVDPRLAELCDRRVTIPMANETESLNAAVAASICMAESARQHVANMQGKQTK